jgi:hypothetical protein
MRPHTESGQGHALWSLLPLSSHMQLTRTSKQDWIRILTDPDPPEMARLLRVGQSVTWPKVRNLPKHRRPYYSLVLSCT